MDPLSEDSASCEPSGLLTLPLELQSVIARMCYEQDAASQQRIKISRHRVQEATQVFTKEYKWYGRSIYALYETCKSLSVLARPYVFETLKLSKAVQPLFCSDLLSSHGELFRHLIFDSCHESSAMRGLIISTLSMPNINQLSFNTTPYHGALQEMASSKPAESLLDVANGFTLHPALARLETGVKKMSCADLTSEDLAAAVKLWPNVEHFSLKLTPASSHHSRTGRRKIINVDAIADLAHLDTLEIGTDHQFGSFNLDDYLDGRARVSSSIPQSWEAMPEKPSLRCLKLATRNCGADLWPFICSFSEALEELHLEIYTYDKSVKEEVSKTGAGSHARFARLHTLTVTGAAGIGWTVLRLLEDAPLKTIDLKLIDLRPDMTAGLFRKKGGEQLFLESLVKLGVTRYGRFPSHEEGTQDLLTENFDKEVEKLGLTPLLHDSSDCTEHYSFYRTAEHVPTERVPIPVPITYGKVTKTITSSDIDSELGAWKTLDEARDSVAFASRNGDTQWVDMVNLALRPLTALMMAVND